MRSDGLERELRSLAGGDGLAFASARARIDDALPVGGQLARDAPAKLARQLRIRLLVGGEARVPLRFGGLALGTRIPLAQDRLGNLEWRVGPIDRGARCRDFLLAERRAMRFCGAGFVRRTLGDHRAAADEVGLDASARASSIAAATARGLWPSTLGITFQPYAAKRIGVLSRNHPSTLPSIEMPLSS